MGYEVHGKGYMVYCIKYIEYKDRDPTKTESPLSWV